MKTYRDILEASKEFIHIVEDGGEFNAIHSVHDHPRLGGQQLKAFKDRKKAIQTMLKTKKKNEVVMTWKKVGHGAQAQWLKGGTFTKSV